jgi:hypothetical protein
VHAVHVTSMAQVRHIYKMMSGVPLRKVSLRKTIQELQDNTGIRRP